MNLKSFAVSCGRLPGVIFLVSVLAGLLAFWLLGGTRSFDYRLLEQTEISVRFIHEGSINDKLDSVHDKEEAVLAAKLSKKVRLFAAILTMPKSKLTKAVHVKATWARRFNKFVFISSEDDAELPSLRAVTTEGRDALWSKTRFSLIYAYQKHLDDFDFFMKADDDTYVIVENLHYILSEKDPNKPILMGRRFKKYAKQGYTSGGAGYVLSRAAVISIAEAILNDTKGCGKGGGAEDVNLGVCADAAGVKIVDSLDEHGLEVFHPFNPGYMMDKGSMDATKWIHDYNHFPIQTGLNCCSDHSASFHYVSPADMYTLEYLLYHLYPHGITRDLSQYSKVLKLRKSRYEV